MSIAHELFADLCEGMIAEASTSMDLLRGLPGAEQLVKKMHQRGKPGQRSASDTPLPHDQEYTAVKSPPWSELKGHREGGFGRWVLVRAQNGAAVIWAPGGGQGYEAYVYHDGEIDRRYDDRGGNILDWIKDHAGKITGYYLGKGSKEIGAPNLTDGVWLYSSSENSIVQTILNGRNNRMPAQEHVLSPDQIRMLTAYVWGMTQGKDQVASR